jgi:hypothetical protein
VVELRAKAAGVVRLVFDATAPNVQHRFVVADSQNEHPYTFTTSMHFDLNVDVPRGVSQMLLKIDPAPTSDADAVMLSQPRVEPGNGATALHPTQTSTDPGF